MSKTGVGPNDDVASAPTVALASVRLAAGGVIADRYEILAPIGEGGMGAVFRVLDRELREEIALKILRPEVADAPGMLDRFRREVKLARRVTHPNVARTFDLGAYQGIRYLTMELVAGDSIASKYPRGSRGPLPEALRIALEVARGLAAAHVVGVIHRDLKPENLLLAGDRVVITDFGIARQQEGSDATRTVGGIVGTPAYMAPEQLEGRELDGRTDVYALGLVLYELLTGAAAFAGDTLYAIAAARLSGDVPDPRKREASLPEPVARLVTEMLAKSRAERPDAQGVVDRLEQLRGGAAAIPERTPQLGPHSIDPARLLHTREARTIAFTRLGPVDESAESIAEELSEALGDAVAGMRGVRVVAATRVRAALGQRTDPLSVAKAVDAGAIIEGSVRVAGDRVRARVRLVDADRGIVTWAERVDGSTNDPFTLEDELVRTVVEAVSAREGESAARGGPTNKRVREIYDSARASYTQFGLANVRVAVATLERGLEEHPGDPWLTSLLGASLTRLWLQTGGSDRDLIARAEELSLRALATDSTIGETFHTIAVLRLNEGDARGAVRAFHETLVRTPLHPEAHQNVGKLLVETGHVEEGVKRLELALRLDPNLLAAHFELVRAHALLGDRGAAVVALERASEKGGQLATVFPRLRLVIWWRDKVLAHQTAQQLAASNTGASWERALPMVRALENDEYWPGAVPLFDNLTHAARGAPRHRAMMYEIAAEYFGAFDQREPCLDAVERAAELPMLDVFWLDRCPTLACVRDDPRFQRARATVATRAAAIWG